MSEIESVDGRHNWTFGQSSRVNAMDDNRNATSQPTATRGACGRHATNNFHTSATRGVRGADSRRVASGRVFHASSTTARDHTDTAVCRPSRGDGLDNSATCDSARVSQYTTPIVDQSVQTESNSAVSDCVHDVYCNKIKASVDSNEFESVNGNLSVKMNQN